MRLAFLGLGLIGGSLAQAVRARDPGGWSVSAWTPTNRGPQAAASGGVVDRVAASVGEAVDGADIVVLAAPPLACLDLLDAVAGFRGRLPPGAVVTDVASTKRRIVARARELSLPFVGGHPMAGREAAGYGSADPKLFAGQPWVVCGADDEGTARVESLALAAGAHPVRMGPAEHDAAVAAISHLPLVMSAVLVEAALGDARDAKGDGSDPRRLAAGGWSSMVRLARGDPEMATGIVATNADEISARLRAARGVIDAWIADLESPAPDVEAVRTRFRAARDLVDDGP